MYTKGRILLKYLLLVDEFKYTRGQVNTIIGKFYGQPRNTNNYSTKLDTFLCIHITRQKDTSSGNTHDGQVHVSQGNRMADMQRSIHKQTFTCEAVHSCHKSCDQL